MFDLGSAVVIGLVVVGLVSLARSLIFGTNMERLAAGVCMVIGIAAVWLVGASDFAHEQVLLNKPLDTLNFWSQLLLGILVGGVASGVWQGYKSVRNIGQNQNDPAPPAVQNVAPQPTVYSPPDNTP